MTSVPKPLKFLRPHYPDLESLFRNKFPAQVAQQDPTTSNLFADILSVLAMTYSDTGNRDTLHYRLLTLGKRTKEDEDPGLWGHEYVRHLAAEIIEENDARQAQEFGDAVPKPQGAQGESAAPESDKAQPFKGADDSKHQQQQEQKKPAHPLAGYDSLLALALLLVPFFLSHNGEAEAVDLLLELENIERIVPLVDENTYRRVCTYMVGCVNLLVPPDDAKFLKTARELYRSNSRFTEAIALAVKLNDMQLIIDDFDSAPNQYVQSQVYILRPY